MEFPLSGKSVGCHGIARNSKMEPLSRSLLFLRGSVILLFPFCCHMCRHIIILISIYKCHNRNNFLHHHHHCHNSKCCDIDNCCPWLPFGNDQRPCTLQPSRSALCWTSARMVKILRSLIGDKAPLLQPCANCSKSFTLKAR